MFDFYKSLLKTFLFLIFMVGGATISLAQSVNKEVSSGFSGGPYYDGVYPCNGPACSSPQNAAPQSVYPQPFYYPVEEKSKTTTFDYSGYLHDDPKTVRYAEPSSVDSRLSVPEYYVRFDLGRAVGDVDADFKGIGCEGATSDLQAPGFPGVFGWGCDPNTNQSITFVEGTIDPVISKTVGFGFNLSPLFRLDLTVSERTGLQFNEEDAVNTSPFFDPDCTDGYCDYSRETQGTLDSYAMMANIYLDIVPRYRYENGRVKRSTIVPYIGIGLGYYMNQFDGLHGQGEYFVDDGCISAANCTVSGSGALYENEFFLESADTSGMAWMAAAGVAFSLGDNLMLDISYKYSDLGTIETGSYFYKVMDVDANGDGFSGGTGDLDLDGDTLPDAAYWSADTNSVETDFIIQEITVGLRYDF